MFNCHTLLPGILGTYRAPHLNVPLLPVSVNKQERIRKTCNPYVADQYKY